MGRKSGLEIKIERLEKELFTLQDKQVRLKARKYDRRLEPWREGVHGLISVVEPYLFVEANKNQENDRKMLILGKKAYYPPNAGYAARAHRKVTYYFLDGHNSVMELTVAGYDEDVKKLTYSRKHFPQDELTKEQLNRKIFRIYYGCAETKSITVGDFINTFGHIDEKVINPESEWDEVQRESEEGPETFPTTIAGTYYTLLQYARKNGLVKMVGGKTKCPE